MSWRTGKGCTVSSHSEFLQIYNLMNLKRNEREPDKKSIEISNLTT
jgi:hypothetical protein